MSKGNVDPVTIYTDGACSGNPGPGGWAAVLSAGAHRKEVAGGKAYTTNNAMELTAVLEALKALKRTGLSVAIYTDSMLVINLLANGHQTRQPHLAVLVRRIRELVATKALAVDFIHVKGHTGIPGNERANALARIEARKAKHM
jgi:ribonuclease HI